MGKESLVVQRQEVAVAAEAAVSTGSALLRSKLLRLPKPSRTVAGVAFEAAVFVQAEGEEKVAWTLQLCKRWQNKLCPVTNVCFPYHAETKCCKDDFFLVQQAHDERFCRGLLLHTLSQSSQLQRTD